MRDQVEGGRERERERERERFVTLILFLPNLFVILNQYNNNIFIR